MGSLQLPPASKIALPEESTPTQNLADAQEIEFSPAAVSVCTTDQSVMLYDRSTLPPLSTAKHWSADVQDNPERMSPLFVNACWSIVVALVHPAAPTVTPDDGLGLGDPLFVDAGEVDVDALGLVGVVAGADVDCLPEACAGPALWCSRKA